MSDKKPKKSVKPPGDLSETPSETGKGTKKTRKSKTTGQKPSPTPSESSITSVKGTKKKRKTVKPGQKASPTPSESSIASATGGKARKKTRKTELLVLGPSFRGEDDVPEAKVKKKRGKKNDGGSPTGSISSVSSSTSIRSSRYSKMPIDPTIANPPDPIIRAPQKSLAPRKSTKGTSRKSKGAGVLTPEPSAPRKSPQVLPIEIPSGSTLASSTPRKSLTGLGAVGPRKSLIAGFTGLFTDNELHDNTDPEDAYEEYRSKHREIELPGAGYTPITTVLPYESIFDWALTDPMGFYRQDEKYGMLRKRFKAFPEYVRAIDIMWEDRKTYHIAKRFSWPPKSGLFYSRGYYGDFEADVGLDLTSLPLTDKERKRRNYLTKDRAFIESVSEMVPLIEQLDYYEWNKRFMRLYGNDTDRNYSTIVTGLSTGQTPNLHDFDPKIYDYLKFTLTSNDPIKMAEFVKHLPPGGKLTIISDGSNGSEFYADWVFKNEAESRPAFEAAWKAGFICVPKFKSAVDEESGKTVNLQDKKVRNFTKKKHKVNTDVPPPPPPPPPPKEEEFIIPDRPRARRKSKAHVLTKGGNLLQNHIIFS